jgi:phage tail-like protein
MAASPRESECVVPVSIPEVNTGHSDPYKNFRFKVLIDGKAVMACQKVSALRRGTQVVEQRSGSEPGVVRKTPGTTSFEPVTLEAGVTHDRTFEQWANGVLNHSRSATPGRPIASAGDFRKDIRIELYDEAGKLVVAYNVFRCWPSEYQALSDLDSAGSTMAITFLKLENEGWERDTAAP